MNRTPESLSAPDDLARNRDYTVGTAVGNIGNVLGVPVVQLDYERIVGGRPSDGASLEQSNLDPIYAQEVVAHAAYDGAQLEQQRVMPADVNGGTYV